MDHSDGVPGASPSVPERPKGVPEHLRSVPGTSQKRPDAPKIASKVPSSDLVSILAYSVGVLGTLPSDFCFDFSHPFVCVRGFRNLLRERSEVGRDCTKSTHKHVFDRLSPVHL